jgi:hypothetical protein
MNSTGSSHQADSIPSLNSNGSQQLKPNRLIATGHHHHHHHQQQQQQQQAQQQQQQKGTGQTFGSVSAARRERFHNASHTMNSVNPVQSMNAARPINATQTRNARTVNSVQTINSAQPMEPTQTMSSQSMSASSCMTSSQHIASSSLSSSSSLGQAGSVSTQHLSHTPTHVHQQSTSQHSHGQIDQSQMQQIQQPEQQRQQPSVRYRALNSRSPRPRQSILDIPSGAPLKPRSLPKQVQDDIEFYTMYGNLSVTTQRQLLKAKYPNHSFSPKDIATAVERCNSSAVQDQDAMRLWLWELSRKAMELAIDTHDSSLEELLREYVKEKERVVRDSI